MKKQLQNVKRKKQKNNNFESLFKLILRTCLVTVFFVFISLFTLMIICWGESVYYARNGITKNPLFNTYIVVTESMVPTININDAIVVKRVKENTINVGDIITFSSNDRFFNGLTITHRVVDKELNVDGNYVYRTKGDNNNLEDTALVELDNIYGKVIIKLPRMGYVHKFITSPGGFVVSVIIPVFLVIIYEIWRIGRTIKKRYAEVEIL